MGQVPEIRITSCNDAPVNEEGDFVLYWMIANRRVRWNFSLQRAVEWSRELNKPLVILEALRCGYKWASDRLHRFIMDGMADNEKQTAKKNVLYYPYLEMREDDGKGLLAALGETACVVVTDDFPEFFLPHMITAAASKLTVKLEKVDSNGLFPMRAADRIFTTAYSFRRFLQKNLPLKLLSKPDPDPLDKSGLPQLTSLPKEITRRWPGASADILGGGAQALSAFPIDHSVGVSPVPGGPEAAQKTLKQFVGDKLHRYHTDRNHPDLDGASGLSPYLHFGHISAHEVFHEVMEREDWSIDRINPPATGSRSGWWGVGEAAEEFLDQLITWRELGYNMCWQSDDYGGYESLPDWAKKTLAAHAADPRPYLYSKEDLEKGRTHDVLWNAAQNQLVREGRLHNYVRMLWGKKILEWSPTPREALAVMIDLNNKYGLDGRNPNSYSGIFWVLGRYDRAWAERPVFGKIRYMSSQNTARKVRVKEYISRYATLQE